MTADIKTALAEHRECRLDIQAGVLVWACTGEPLADQRASKIDRFAHLAAVLAPLIAAERADAAAVALADAADQVEALPWDAVRVDSLVRRFRANAHIYRTTNPTDTKEAP